MMPGKATYSSMTMKLDGQTKTYRNSPVAFENSCAFAFGTVNWPSRRSWLTYSYVPWSTSQASANDVPWMVGQW